MRKDTTFSDKKMTQKEFSKKYWMNGKAPYQYHTGTIENARDEREQFVFNNIRALYELQKKKVEFEAKRDSERGIRIARLEKKTTISTITNMIALGLAIILFITKDLK